METIIKIDAPIEAGEFEIDVPGKHQVLTFSNRFGATYIWVAGDQSTPMRKRKFKIIQNGQQVDIALWHYVASCRIAETDLHLFQS